MRILRNAIGPGLRAPALFFTLTLAVAPLAAPPATGQAQKAQPKATPARPTPATARSAPSAPRPAPARPPQQQPARAIPVPDRLGGTKLAVSLITAVDHANKTGNYSVLLALGSTAFQNSNSPASLGAVFSTFRERQIDLSDVLVLAPTFEVAPTAIAPDTIRMRGRFGLQRGPLGFELIFKWEGGWRLQGISLIPPAPPPAAPAAPPPPRR
jgi:hypothetical protein